jgi:Ti-type conjugative transfer relaxase TraA
MAIYHFSAKLISRAAGSSALASAAYRSASRLYDQRLDRAHDFSNKAGVVHSEVMLPDDAPEEFSDRERLWNAVEAAEVRKDAQLAREIEFAIPREMDQADGIELARSFVQREFVDRGMIADLNVHWDVSVRDGGADGLAKPHAHVMLTTREVGEDGFGAKVRDWNRTELLSHWREAWAEHVNENLAELDLDVRVDHRSLEAQGIDLEPQNKIGAAGSRRFERDEDAERAAEHHAIARRNGERIIAEPKIALDAITHQQATFTARDLAVFVHRHSDDAEQFGQAMSAVRSSPELVALGRDGRGQERFTSREMVEVERRLHRASEVMAKRERHPVADRARDRALERTAERGLSLSEQQREALAHVTDGHDLGLVIGYAGTGKSAMLGVAREAWEEAGYQVRGVALSGIAAENLETGSGISSRTIASLQRQWEQERELLSSRDVLVIDEAGMVGTRQMERLLTEAQSRGAKVVLVGDPEQLQAIEAGAAFRSIAERHPHVEITEIRRQREDWQRDATRHLATGRTREALDAYEAAGHLHAAPTREQAREALVEGWDRERLAESDQSRIILTYTNDEVRALNLAARDRMRAAGELGAEVSLQVGLGERDFAVGDRVMFLKNDRGLGVKNGLLGEIEAVSTQSMSVRLGGGRSVGFDLKDYAELDHGYAATIHKAQGVTVDRAHVLATPGLDRHGSYVALSRHRDGVEIHYGRDDFDSLDKLSRTLSRERAKDMASDYERAAPEVEAEAPQRGSEPGSEKTPDKAPEKGRGIFDGFRASARAPEPSVLPTALNPADLRRDLLIERHAKAVKDILRMRDQDLPSLPHQIDALNRARDALGAVQAKDLERAYLGDRSLIGEAASGKTQRTLQAAQLEAEIRIGHQQRADRFVERWQGLERQRQALDRAGDDIGLGRVEKQMEDMAFGLKRDAQLESLLRNRRRELGLGAPAHDAGVIAHELIDSLGLGRRRSLGISM